MLLNNQTLPRAYLVSLGGTRRDGGCTIRVGQTHDFRLEPFLHTRS